MFRGRRQLQRRDVESGLTFDWRVPVSNTGSLVLAVLLVAVVAVALATTVRVRIAGEGRAESEPGTLVLVPGGPGADRLERRAIEAGPYPLRWNPAADPEYVGLRRQALRTATDGGVPYQPQPVLDEPAAGEATPEPWFQGAVLPSLPAIQPPVGPAGPREVMLGARVLDLGQGLGFSHAALPLAAAVAGEAIGARYLLEYDQDGRVLDVVALGTRKRRAVVSDWLTRGRVTGNPGEGGWLSVETVAVR